MVARMNENSPIWAKLAATVTAVVFERPKALMIARAASDLPTMMMPSTASTVQGWASTTNGLNNIPTDTKNSTANASRKGSVSSAARWLSSDSARIMPAKKVPSAKETPNSIAAPNATPSATASTANRNNSREPVWAT